MNFSAYGDLQYGSSGINNNFLEYIMFGGQLDSSTKAGFLGDLEDINRMAGEYSTNAHYIIPAKLFKSENIKAYAELGMMQAFRLDVDRDFLELALNGNAQYLGQEMSLDMQLNRFHSQYVGIGVSMKNNALQLGLRVHKGSDFITGSSLNSSFYTSLDAHQVDLNAELDLQYSNTRKTGIGAANGTGIGISAQYIYDKAVKFRIEDLGMMFWSVRSKTMNVDSLYTYTGFEFNDLINNTFNTPELNDTLGIAATNVRENMIMPFRLSVERLAIVNESHRINWTATLNYRYLYHSLPELMGGLRYWASNSTQLDLRIGYGGYYKLHGGIGLLMNFKPGIELSLRSNAIANSLRNNGYGYNVNIGVRVKI